MKVFHLFVATFGFSCVCLIAGCAINTLQDQHSNLTKREEATPQPDGGEEIINDCTCQPAPDYRNIHDN